MTAFVSHAEQIREILERIVDCDPMHAKWLNTLSYLENCGARKIAACEHPTLVKEEMLKHASEEFRHAHYLKRQILKVSTDPLETYVLTDLLGGFAALHYLRALDVRTSRYLKRVGFSKNSLKEAAYLLVTYAIERRAEELYPLYEEVLRKRGSRIAIKSIILEEKEHLKEMEAGLQKMAQGWDHAAAACALEGALCKRWLDSIPT